MRKKIIVITASPRKGSNSEKLADEFIKGAIDSGHETEKILLREKEVNFCRGCLACWELKKCVMDNDDANSIANKVFHADVIVFATPIYFYEMSGQLKTVLDRIGSLYTSDYNFRDVYLITASANPDTSSMDGAVKGIEGWVRCFEKAKLAGVIRGAGFAAPSEVSDESSVCKAAYDMGVNV